ncbi:MAG: tripartite tricarboxylate transporter substrate binding protein [Acetobacteraceae bacterium]|nr:tripartite tricarboxylate transporter substrate binding protein [Acetobacteraceae bacterium]
MFCRFVVAAMLAAGLLAGDACAQANYPTKPVRMIVSFAVGGPTDLVARVVAAKLSESLGQQFVVENRPGAGGNIGADMVSKAAPDGYTLLMATVSTHATNPLLYKKIPYDPVTGFTPIGQVGITPIVLVVHPSLPVTDVKGLIELIKNNPGKYSYGSSGLGSILQLCGEHFRALAGGIDYVHVPYRGSAPMMNDLVAGQIPIAFDGTPSAMPQIEAKAIRVLATGTQTRARQLPDVPTLAELGFPSFDCYTWNAIFAPPKTPEPIVKKLNEAIQKLVDDPPTFKRLQELGIDPTPKQTPAMLEALVKAELAKWAPVAKATGVQLD